jgi:hypothetical protein
MPRSVLFSLLLFIIPNGLRAHPTTPNQAIQAVTIVEVFVSPSEIRLELEIGDKDRKIFEPLLGPKKDRFFDREFVIEADGEILRGEVVKGEPRKRLIRDPITGEPQPRAPSTEQVTFIEVRYPLATKPTDLIVKPPFEVHGPAANIGVVFHHGSMPVNDFDFLNYRETLRLDWADPWYSRIRSPRLKRYYNSPLSVFVYVDPREVRVEIILRLRTLLTWLPLDIGSTGLISKNEQSAVQKRIGEFLISRTPLHVEGVAVTPLLDQLQFLRLNMAKIEAVQNVDATSVDTTMVGAVLVHPTERKAADVKLRWGLFGDKIVSVPGTMNQSPAPKMLTPSDPVLAWRSPEEETPRFDVRVLKPAQPKVSLPVPSLLSAMVAGYLLYMGCCITGGRSRRWMLAAVVLVLGGLLWSFGRVAVDDPFAKSRRLTDAEAKQVMQVLLENVYHAFDFRGEEAIYDTLSTSVAGELLRQTYLDIRKSLEVQNQTARAKAVSLESVEITPLENDTGLTAHCRWTVRAAVTHWGHTHERTQLYEGDLTIQWRDDTWKITALNLLDQKDVEAPKPVEPQPAGRP